MKQTKRTAGFIVAASSVLLLRAGYAAGQTATYTWNGAAGDGVWQTGASQTNWNGNTYNPGNGGGNNFVFVDPAYNKAVSTISLTNGHNPNVDNITFNSSITSPLAIVINGTNTGTHLDLGVLSTEDSLDVNATGCEIDSVSGGAIQLFGSGGIWAVNGTATVFSVNAPIVDTGAFNRGFQKRGSGTLRLAGSSAFDGALISAGGVLELDSLANVGQNSAAGTGSGSGAAGIQIGNVTSITFRAGNVVYNGPDNTTNRPFIIAKDTRMAYATTDVAALTTMGNTLTLTGGIYTNPTTTNPGIYTALTLGGAGNIIVNSNGLVGDITLLKTGVGELQINTPSSWYSDTKVAAGTLTLNSDVTNAASFTIASGATLNLNAAGTIPNLAAINATGTVNINNNPTGSLLQSRQTGVLTVSTGGAINLGPAASPSARTVLTTPALIIAGTTNAWTGKVDLANNDLIVQAGANTSLATVTNQIAAGYNNGTWDGQTGIASVAAKNDPNYLTALGAITNDDGTGNSAALYSSFGRQNTAFGDVLVKYTYYGDANLDGVVDGSDYSKIDFAYANNQDTSATPLTGWANGDFNYDGVIDGSDYTLIDNAFNTQGAPGSAVAGPSSLLASATSAIAPAASAVPERASSTVPEPASSGVLALLAVNLLGCRRRNRRQDQ